MPSSGGQVQGHITISLNAIQEVEFRSGSKDPGVQGYKDASCVDLASLPT